jgi:hypothetical protein
MYEGKYHTFSLDALAQFSELGDRLAAKRSTKMPQKHQQNRTGLEKCIERLASLRFVFHQKRRINQVLWHFFTRRLPRDITESFKLAGPASPPYFLTEFFSETSRAVFSDLTCRMVPNTGRSGAHGRSYLPSTQKIPLQELGSCPSSPYLLFQ